MGGSLGARNFPFPSAIGGSQNVNPLTQAQQPDGGFASAAPGNPLLLQPSQTQQPPLIPPGFNPVNPARPSPSPNPLGQMRRFSPLYG